MARTRHQSQKIVTLVHSDRHQVSIRQQRSSRVMLLRWITRAGRGHRGGTVGPDDGIQTGECWSALRVAANNRVASA